ncbi:MAG: hypothetical protein ACREMG_09900, partial [Gemmatimonadales bacterium]
LQVGARRFAADLGGLLDPPQGPAQAAEGENLVLDGVAQDVAHGAEEHEAPACVSTSQSLRPVVAGFEVSLSGRIWVSPEAEEKRQANIASFREGRIGKYADMTYGSKKEGG